MAHRIEPRARTDQHFACSGRSLLVTDLEGRVTGSGTEGFALGCRVAMTAGWSP